MNVFNVVLALCGVLEVVYSFSHDPARPNFIFLLTDDQDLEFDSVDCMPNLQRYIVDKGITFDNSFVATPICCASRTESIAGRYYQNVGAPNGTCMMVDAEKNVFDPTTMFQQFSAAGYATGMFGKLTNDMDQYFCTYEPPRIEGFSRIHAPCLYNNFYGRTYFDKFDNGSYIVYNVTFTPSVYETSQIGNASIEWLQSIAGSDTPFFTYLGPHAPHFPSTSPPWYADAFENATAPRTPNFNQLASDHHPLIATNPLLEDDAIEFIDQTWRNRLRTLLSVDDIIGELIPLLEEHDVLDNTYFLFTSDHGYHLGQWRVPCSKEQMYETDIRVPLFLRGPGIAASTFTEQLVGNVDILPTFLQLAGIDVPTNIDGKSWVDSLVVRKNMDPTKYTRIHRRKKHVTEAMEIVNNTILSQSSDDNQWRHVFMSQYRCGEILDFSHCATWYPLNGTLFPGHDVEPMHTNSEGQKYMIDDYDNNWRAVRIMNDTHNMVYGEYIGYEWAEKDFENPTFYELYDLYSDPWQMTNLYPTIDDATKQELHKLVMDLGSCHDVSCP